MNIVTAFTAALLYTAIAIGANQATANEGDLSHLESLRSGDMRKLVFTGNTASPSDLGDKIVLDENGNEIRFATLLADRPVLINFWATWCAPCRKEMPSLDSLAASFPGQEFAVLPVATGKNSVEDILAFFEDIEVSGLPILRDPGMDVAGSFGVFGIPTTLILDRSGAVIARLSGDADWNSESARAIVQAIIDMQPSS